jgi:hypothetical protein
LLKNSYRFDDANAPRYFGVRSINSVNKRTSVIAALGGTDPGNTVVVVSGGGTQTISATPGAQGTFNLNYQVPGKPPGPQLVLSQFSTFVASDHRYSNRRLKRRGNHHGHCQRSSERNHGTACRIRRPHRVGDILGPGWQASYGNFVDEQVAILDVTSPKDPTFHGHAMVREYRLNSTPQATDNTVNLDGSQLRGALSFSAGETDFRRLSRQIVRAHTPAAAS